MTPLVRGLLARGCADSTVGGVLWSNYVSGEVYSDRVAYEERKLKGAEMWLDDPERAVRTWAQQIVDEIEGTLPRIRTRWEEERAEE